MRIGTIGVVPLIGALVFMLALGCSSDGSDAPGTPSSAPQSSATPTPQVDDSSGEMVVTLHISTPAGDRQTGTAVLTSIGDTTNIEINVAPPALEAQPMHIHFGNCSEIGSIFEGLENVILGHSSTTLEVPMDRITVSGMLINIHASFDDFPTSTGCVEMPVLTS
ncbi:MAG: hypothetical protein HQ478_04815 [Chloroflexi bacterium]|nr:hypothetical protein [Chloroflexota bacterium]